VGETFAAEIVEGLWRLFSEFMAVGGLTVEDPQGIELKPSLAIFT